MDSTDIVFVLDASGSMEDLANDVVGGFNHFIEEQRKLPGDAYVTLWTFDTNAVLQRYQAKPLLEVPALTNDTYYKEHGNGTPLLDAVGKAIVTYDALSLRAAKTIFVINTDGEENSSREYTFDQIKALVDERTAKGWAFVFLGANNSEWQGARMGTTASARYDATSAGVRSSYDTLSRNVSMVRASASAANVTTKTLDWNSDDPQP